MMAGASGGGLGSARIAGSRMFRAASCGKQREEHNRVQLVLARVPN